MKVFVSKRSHNDAIISELDLSKISIHQRLVNDPSIFRLFMINGSRSKKTRTRFINDSMINQPHLSMIQ